MCFLVFEIITVGQVTGKKKSISISGGNIHTGDRQDIFQKAYVLLWKTGLLMTIIYEMN